jgi:hypothetical protein
MKKQYITPLTEIVQVRTYRMLLGDGTGTIETDPNPSEWSVNTRVDARSYDGNFLEEDTGEQGYGYRRYNLWDR